MTPTKPVRRLAALACLLPLASPALAGVNAWKSGGPHVTYVDALAIHPHDPSTLYAATREGVAVSRDAGATWRDAGALGEPAFDLAIDPVTPSTMYAATHCQLHKSVDGGASWTPLGIQAGARRSCDFQRLAIDPRDPDVVYAASFGDSEGCPGCYRGSVYRSADGGVTWTDVAADLDTYSHGALVVGADSSVYAGTEQGVLRSADGGATWSLDHAGLPDPDIFALATDPSNPSTLYAGIYGGTYRSLDAGASWQPLYRRQDVAAVALAVDPRDPATLYAGVFSFRARADDGGLLRSTDGGATWRNVKNDAGSRLPRALAVAAGGRPAVYAGTHGAGVLRSVNGGAWKVLDLDASTTIDVTALAFEPRRPPAGRGFALYAGTRGAGVHKSVGRGATWRAANAGLTEDYIETLAVDPRDPAAGLPAIIYAGGLNRVFRSIDGGATWQASRPFCDDYCPVTRLALDRRGARRGAGGPMAVYAAAGSGLFRSRNGGRTWQDLTAGLPQDVPERRVSALAVDDRGPARGRPSILYAALGTVVLRSRDEARTWEELTIEEPAPYVISLVTAAGRPGRAATIFAVGFPVPYRSDDGGASWTPLPAICDEYCRSIATLVVDPLRPDVVYAATYDNAVVRSDDGGARWGSRLDLPAGVNVFSLAVHPRRGTLFAATSRGVFERSLRSGGELAAEPGAGEAPGAHHGGAADAEHLGDLLEAQPGEIAQAHHSHR